MKPLPEPVDPARLPELARETIRVAKYPMLASVDPEGQPRVRPVSPVRTRGFTVWVASLRSSGKTAELAANPRVELCYLEGGHDHVRITGRAVLVEDRAEIQSIWDENPLMRSFLGTVDNPELMLYRVEPERVRFMREWALDYHEVPLQES
ncbi:MAG: pyridoxamine 5-phosphate oxidase [Acidobacteria bacterium]|nr:pyridoxamine 5-phosphate oxidase [Acidobacteriota bacterium]